MILNQKVKEVGKTNNYWLLGFVTGRNFADNENRGIHTDKEFIPAWVYNYCQKNPLNNIVTASEALAREQEKRSQ